MRSNDKVHGAGDPGFLTGTKPEGKPWLLAFLAILIVILPEYSAPLGKHWLSPLRLIPIALAGLMVMSFVLLPRRGANRTVKPGVLLIVLFAALQSCSYVTSDFISDPGIIRGGQLLSSQLLLAWCGIALFSMTRISSTRQRSFVLAALLVGLVYACVVAALQNFADTDLRLLFQPPGFREAPALTGIGPVNEPTVLRYGAKRSIGTVDYPIEMSAMAAIAILLAVHFARFARFRAVRIMSRIAIPIALIGLVAAGSRTGLVSLAAALLFYFPPWKIRDVIVGAAGASVAVASLVVLLPTNSQVLWKTITEGAAGEEGSVNVRLEKAAVAPQIIHEYPIFGIGANTFPSGVIVWDSQWMSSLTQGGLVGASALILLIVAGIAGATAAARAATNPGDLDQVRVMRGIWIGIAVTTFTTDTFSSTQLTLVWFLVLGLQWSSVTVSVDGV